MSYERMYYTIGQVSKISALPQSVLRYWETVFDSLNPPKSDGGTRQYTENDVEIILDIKKLLYDDGYTIKGANKHIKSKYSQNNQTTKIEAIKVNDNKPVNKSEPPIDNISVQRIKQRIHLILDMLEE